MQDSESTSRLNVNTNHTHIMMASSKGLMAQTLHRYEPMQWIASMVDLV